MQTIKRLQTVIYGLADHTGMHPLNEQELIAIINPHNLVWMIQRAARAPDCRSAVIGACRLNG